MDVAELEKALAQEQAAEAATLEADSDAPEDFWAPSLAPLDRDSVDIYGPISPIPEHDGTDCLKWDSSLWSHGDHFKVRGSFAASGMESGRSVCYCEYSGLLHAGRRACHAVVGPSMREGLCQR